VPEVKKAGLKGIYFSSLERYSFWFFFETYCADTRVM
jgi:hypothetical protein